MKKTKLASMFLAIVMIISVFSWSINAVPLRDRNTFSGMIDGCEVISEIMFAPDSVYLTGWSTLATDGSGVFTDFLGKAAVTCTIVYSDSERSGSDYDENYMYYNPDNDPSYACQASHSISAGGSIADVLYVTTDHEYYVNGSHVYTFGHYFGAGEDF